MKSNRNTTSRISSGTRTGYTGIVNPGVLPSYKQDWKISNGVSVTGISGSTPDTSDNPKKRYAGGAKKGGVVGQSGYAILESDIGDFNKFSKAKAGYGLAAAFGSSRQSAAGQKANDDYNAFVSGANARTMEALSKSALHNLGAVKYSSVMNDGSLGQSGTYTPKAGEKFKFGQHSVGKERGNPTGIYSESTSFRTKYSDDIPGTAVGEGQQGPRDRRYLAINKAVGTDNSLKATQAGATPGDLLKKKMSYLNRVGRISMPSGGGSGDEPRINISSSGVTGLNFG